MSVEPRTVAAVAGGGNGVVGVGGSGAGNSGVSGGADDAGDIATVENGRECNNVGNGDGGKDGGGVGVDDQSLQHDDSTVTVLHIPKRVKRMGKVDFVRFDSKETVYTDEHQDELITNKIKEEIKR